MLRPLQRPSSKDVRAAWIACANWPALAPVISSTMDSSDGFSTVNVWPSPLTKAPLI